MCSKKIVESAKLESVYPTLKVNKCPICKKEALNTQYFPFCSLRCSELDMYNWFSNSYSVPAYELDDVEKEELIKFLEESDSAKE